MLIPDARMCAEAGVMRYRKLGGTGLELSVLSFGASSLGGVFHDIDESEGVRTLHEVVEQGINFIDVAPYYGLTKAEAVLGRALRDVPRDRVVLATKVGRYGDTEFDFSAARVKASVDESLARLGVDHVDLIQCHDIEYVKLDQIVEQTLPALREVVAAGKARFIGITGLPLKIFREMRRRLGPGGFDTILSYCHYALNDTSLKPLAQEFAGEGVGVINASPTGMGMLTDRGVPAWHPAPPQIREACARAVALCRARGKSITDLAMRFAVEEPSITTTLVSTATPAHMRHNIAACDAPLDTELLAEVQAVLAPVMNQTWPSGLPENNA
jgi:L-galactose dehydrogenase